MIAKIFLLACLVSFASACANCGCGCGCSKPKFNVVLDNCGPGPQPLPVINAAPHQTPCIEKPIIPLPACIHPTKTIANTCRCVKTVVKPQVYQQVITVPSVQRYLQTSSSPVVEHINYEGVPVNCPPCAGEAPVPAYIDVAPAVCGYPAYPAAPACYPAAAPAYYPAAAPACYPAAPACLPAAPACLPAVPACLPAVPACLPAVPACLPAVPACLPAVSACLPAAPACYPAVPACY